MGEGQSHQTSRPDRRNLYGRGRRRSLRPGRRKALETLLPLWSIPGVAPEENPRRLGLSPQVLVGCARDCWLEIGFGSGEHLLAMASAHPDIGMIGAEPYPSGVASLLMRLASKGPDNLRIHPGDGRDLLDVIPDGFVGRTFLLYPDPWPKRRHAKRRIVSARNLDALARVMRPGAELRIATDMQVFVRHALRKLAVHGDFDWTAEGPNDWRQPWQDWPGTRYEQKAKAEGRQPVYLTCVRRNG